MGRILSFLLAFVLVPSAVLWPVAGRAVDRGQPMRFYFYRERSPDGCSDKCKSIISAFGAVTADTPHEFERLTRGRNVAGAMLALDSDGGSVHGAIALGREIRRLGLDTTVGHVVGVTEIAGVSYGTISPGADCESMCAFVLLAGVRRMVPDEARVMVHQIWLGDRRDDPTAAHYSAEDLVLVQQDIGRLAQYTMEMGASIDVLDLSLRIPPWEPMHLLSREELQRMRVATDAPDRATGLNFAAALSPTPPAMQLVSDGSLASEISEQAWAVIDRSGATILARRHPLTIEGDEVGDFDLLFSCGSESGSYDISYIERRHARESAPLPEALRAVILRSGGQQLRLKVVSSLQKGEPQELLTYASGAVPAAVIDRLAEGQRSLTIQTKSAQSKTSIRIGNTGVQRSLPQLASHCATPRNVHARLDAATASSVASAK